MKTQYIILSAVFIILGNISSIDNIANATSANNTVINKNVVMKGNTGGILNGNTISSPVKCPPNGTKC